MTKGQWRQTTKRQYDKRQNDKPTVTLFLRAPLVAIGAQKWNGKNFAVCKGQKFFIYDVWKLLEANIF